MDREITGLPKHYMKEFHPDYTDTETLKARRVEAGMDTWSQLFIAMSDRTQNRNPNLPSLLPWIVKEGIPTNPVRYVRNPYYWAVDAEGQQRFAVGVVNFTPTLRVHALNVRNIPPDRGFSLTSALYVEEKK